MKTSSSILILFAFIFYSCQEQSNKGREKQQTQLRQNKITKLSFATGGCLGECPFMALEIDSTLDFKFYGGKYSKLQGFYSGKISQSIWDSINIKFEPLQNRNLDNGIRTLDDMAIQNIIHFGKTIKNISAQEMELPEDVRNDYHWLMEVYKKGDLTKMTDTIHFETSLQNEWTKMPKLMGN